jgi:hypothetical protein
MPRLAQASRMYVSLCSLDGSTNNASLGYADIDVVRCPSPSLHASLQTDTSTSVPVTTEARRSFACKNLLTFSISSISYLGWSPSVVHCFSSVMSAWFLCSHTWTSRAARRAFSRAGREVSMLTCSAPWKMRHINLEPPRGREMDINRLLLWSLVTFSNATSYCSSLRGGGDRLPHPSTGTS